MYGWFLPSGSGLLIMYLLQHVAIACYAAL